MALKDGVNKLKLFSGEVMQLPNITNAIASSKGEQAQDKAYNPFLKKDGTLLNKYLDYQGLLDSDKTSDVAKKYIMEATGLVPATAKTKQSATETSAISNGIAEAAQKYIGTPYVWGGSDISHGGMDCSGFVYKALNDAGYNVGRTNAQGYRSRGTVIDKSEIQPGDLIFYGKNNNASHIGIYLGNGQVIHSSGGSKNTKNNPGKGVIISDVDHRSDFIEARRY